MKDIQLGHYKTTHGVCTCMYWEGNRFVHVLTLDIPLKVRKRTKQELKFITPLYLRGGGPYPMLKFLKYYRRALKWGGSKSAKKLIKEAAKQARGDLKVETKMAA